MGLPGIQQSPFQAAVPPPPALQKGQLKSHFPSFEFDVFLLTTGTLLGRGGGTQELPANSCQGSGVVGGGLLVQLVLGFPTHLRDSYFP